jgi:cytidyltransferase-like protein
MEAFSGYYGSIIHLKKEFEERYIVLHRHTFPQVLEQIRRSNITDYTIFLHNGLLFSHMVYSGEDYQKDMNAIGDDATTREWWKLTDSMQEPLDGNKEGEWWSPLEPWFELEPNSPAIDNPVRLAYKFTSPFPLGKFPASFADDSQDNIIFSGIYRIRVFRKGQQIFVYIETSSISSVFPLLSSLRSALDLSEWPEPMTEVFHTDHRQPLPEMIQKKVFVTGCFDLLHSGHIAFLQEAAGYGDLYVSIGSDANVEHLKGRYPVNSQAERKYMIDALACVKECRINSGWGIIDFEKELRDIMPDFFIVNEDGHTPAKQALCKDMGIDYKVLKRIPHADLPVRSTTSLRTECTIPFRIDLAGGWLDQPFVSKHHPGPVLTISIEPTVEFNERSGMSSSTRRKAIELWKNEIPLGDAEQLARLLFSFENPPGTKEVAGSQDSLGIVMPGLNRLDYNGNYWPEKITPVHDEGILTWIEKNLYLVTLGPRVNTYSVLDNTKITSEGAAALSAATVDCWNAILKRDIKAFGEAFRGSFEAQVAMFPNRVDQEILETINLYKEKAWGWKLSGAGGGGYLILVSGEPIEGAMQIKIRRKNTL